MFYTIFMKAVLEHLESTVFDQPRNGLHMFANNHTQHPLKIVCPLSCEQSGCFKLAQAKVSHLYYRQQLIVGNWKSIKAWKGSRDINISH